MRLLKLIPEGGISEKELKEKEGVSSFYQLAWTYGMKRKWFKKEGDLIKKVVSEAKDEDSEYLKNIEEGKKISDKADEAAEKKIFDELKRRKAIELDVVKYYYVKKGAQFSLIRKKKATDLTQDMILKGTWKEESFKPYNFNALGKEIDTGNLHPLLKARSQFVEVLLEMGFEEMPTNQFVESSFWNFDTLFVPQQHPARDA
jgi:phenylalanyl-tRNA synthetase alpha chain